MSDAVQKVEVVKSPILSNSTYDVVNDIVIVAFPLFVTAYASFGALFAWPDVEKWVAAAGILGTLLGGLLKAAQRRWQKQPVEYDGVFVANDPDPMANTFRQELDKGLVELGNQKEVRLKVVNLLPPETSQ